MRTFILILFLAPVFSLHLCAQNAGDSPKAALNAVFEKGNLMAALSSHDWRPGLNLAAGYLSVGRSISLNITLREGVEYVFMASGPNETTDVDLYLRDTEGKLLAEDFEDDGTPVLEFRAPAGATYQLQLHLAGGTVPETFVALCLLRKRGLPLTERNYRSVTTGFFAAATQIRAAGPETNWQKKAGEWCLFGFSLGQNEGTTLRELRPQTGKNMFAAAAGPEPSEITLYLASEAGRIVAGTDRPEAYPMLRYDCPPGAVFDLRVSAPRAKAHIFALVGVFHQ